MRLCIPVIAVMLGCIPAAAGYRTQQIFQVPATPGQSLSSMAVDSHGNVIVAATTATSASVISMNPNGSQRFVHPLGGTGIVALALDSHDDIYVARGAGIFKLSGQDGSVVYATPAPSLGSVFSVAITVDRTGQVVLAALAFSGGPSTTPGAYSTGSGGISDTSTYLIRLSATGAQIFVARYGGTSHDSYGSSTQSPNLPSYTIPTQVLVDGHNNIWVAGNTNTINLPLTSNALKASCGCSIYAGDGFLAEFSGDGSSLLYATYIGTTSGNLFNSDGNDTIGAMALDTAGHIWLAGSTNGPDLPVTPDALQKQYNGTLIDGTFADPRPPDPTDGFLFEYDPVTNRVLYATYFGGVGADSIANLAAAPDGTIVFTGTSASLPFALGGFTRGGSFIAALNGPDLTVTTLIEGSAGAGLSLLAPGSVAICGTSNVVTILQQGSDTAANLAGIANAGGGLAAGQVAPGELVALYGANLGPATSVTADLSSGNAPLQLGGVEVLADGSPIPLLYVQRDQVNAVIPFAASGSVELAVTYAGQTSNVATLGVAAAEPEAFKNGVGMQAAALNQDQTVNRPGNPAQAGTIVSVFATGFGALTPSPRDGLVLTGLLPVLNASPIEVLWGVIQPEPLEVTYAGPAPNMVAGVTQVNFRLPSTPPSDGQVTLSFQVAGWPGSTFSVAVKQ